MFLHAIVSLQMLSWLRKFFPPLFVLYPQFTSTTPTSGSIKYFYAHTYFHHIHHSVIPNCSFWSRKWRKLVGKYRSSIPEHYQWEGKALWGETALGGTDLPLVINCVGNEKASVGCPVALDGIESNWWTGEKVGCYLTQFFKLMTKFWEKESCNRDWVK